MYQVTKNVYSETLIRGCNPSFITTSDGVFMVDTPQLPIDAMRWREHIMEARSGPIRYLVNTEPHADHITGNAYYPEAEVIGQEGLKTRYESQIPNLTSEERVETAKQNDPASVWLINHPSYPPNPPTRIFKDEITIDIGNTKIQCINHPGHTKPQTSVYVADEGVILTGDNIFHKVRTWVQECDPWELIDALDKIGSFDVQYIVPGHGPVCDKSYLKEQKQIVQNWLGAVEEFVKKGMTEEEALAQPTPDADPYPMDLGLFPLEERVGKMNVSNIYKHVAAKMKAS